MKGGRSDGRSGNSESGFSLFELAVVLFVISILTGLTVVGFGEYSKRTASRRAAEVFARDLGVARAAAVGERFPVSIVFDVASSSYEVRRIGGEVLISRDFSVGGEIPLSSIDLEVDSDSVVFNERGVLDFSSLSGPLAVALFYAGDRAHRVSFNATGTAQVVGL